MTNLFYFTYYYYYYYYRYYYFIRELDNNHYQIYSYIYITIHLNTISAALSIIRRLSTRKLRFDPRPVHVGFVIDNLELEAARSRFDPGNRLP